jgi:ABC-type antimicrobial peptide transport system permease subunit
LIGRQPAPAEIVGLAGDVRNSGLALASQPQIYLPFPQIPWGNMNLVVRTVSDPHNMAAPIRAQIAALDPDQPVTAVQTVEELMDGSRAQPRFMMFLLAAFSVASVVLAMIGIYGVLAYSVAQRRQELGIRLALGAEKSDIVRMVVKQGIKLTLLGAGIGLMAALALTRVMGSLLYQTGARDLTTFVLSPLAFLAIAMLASYLPARKATSVQPTEALRHG